MQHPISPAPDFTRCPAPPPPPPQVRSLRRIRRPKSRPFIAAQHQQTQPKKAETGGIAVATLELSSRWPPKPKKRNEWAEDGSLVLAAAKREGGRRGGRTIGSVRWRENWISNALMVAPPPPNTLTPSPAAWPVPPERKISKGYSLCPVFLLPRNT